MRLSACTPGQEGRILTVEGEGPAIQRLSEMGIIEGTHVKVVRVAPLGDPMEVELMGYLLTMRRQEAGLVEVEVVS